MDIKEMVGMKNDFTKEQLSELKKLKEYAGKHGGLKAKDLIKDNGLRSITYYKRLFNVKTLKDIIKIAEINIPDEYQNAYFSKRRNITDEELLDELRRYYFENGVPTSRGLSPKNGFPSSNNYYKRFGSLKNAIELAEIEIPEKEQWLFDRCSLSDDEIKRQIKEYVESFISSGKKLPTRDEINSQKSLPSTAVITKRFGGLNNLYRELGYDENHNHEIYIQELVDNYHKIAKKINRTPTSRDLDKFSLLGECHSASAYARAFNSIHDLQINMGYEPTDIGRNKSEQELINDVLLLANKLGRVPMQRDFTNSNGVASVSLYNKKFDGFHNALRKAGFLESEIGYKTYRTSGGTICLSVYEYRVACLFESDKIPFKKEVRYDTVILDLDRHLRFDYVFKYENKTYYMEIFGMVGNKDYDIRVEEKLRMCQENNIPLISLYPDDFWSIKKNELRHNILNQINELKKIY